MQTCNLGDLTSRVLCCLTYPDVLTMSISRYAAEVVNFNLTLILSTLNPNVFRVQQTSTFYRVLCVCEFLSNTDLKLILCFCLCLTVKVLGRFTLYTLSRANTELFPTVSKRTVKKSFASLSSTRFLAQTQCSVRNT